MAAISITVVIKIGRRRVWLASRMASSSGTPPANEQYTSTRWLCCGYGFSGVGCSRDTAYFAEAQSGGRAHFQHNYFKLGLLAHFHRASLLNFKVRIVVAWIAYHVLDLGKHREGEQAQSFWNRKSTQLLALFVLPILLASLIIAFARSPDQQGEPAKAAGP